MLDGLKKFLLPRLFSKELKTYLHELDRNLGAQSAIYNGRVLDYQNDKRKIQEAFSNWFYSTTDDIARVICQAEYEFVEYAPNGDERVLGEDIFYDMVDNPNPSMGRMELWYLTWSEVRSFGNSFWYTPINKFGKRAQFYFMHADYGQMYVKKDGRSNVIGYELDKGNGAVEKFTPEEIIHFRYPSILSSTYGKSPAMHFKEMIDLDLKIKEQANTSLDNGLNISKVISSEKPLGEKNETLIKNQLREMTGTKAKRTWITAFGSTIKVEDLSQSLKDIDYLQALEKTRKQIYAANGVPLLDESVNRSVAEVGQYVFMLKTIMPDLRMFADFLNRNIFWKYNARKSIRFKDMVPGDRKLEAEILNIYRQASALTPDEIREELNKPPFDRGIGAHPMATRNDAKLEDVVNKQLQNFFAEGRAIPQNKQDDPIKSELEKLLENRGNGHDG